MSNSPIVSTKPVPAPQRSGRAGASLRLSAFTPYRFVALGRMMSERLGRAYADENLTIPEWRVLAVISEADAMAARDVVAKTPMDKMAVSRAAASLEQKGYVVRKGDPADRRVNFLMLSAKGRALYERVAALALDYEAALLKALSEEERAQFKRMLTKLEDFCAGDMASEDAVRESPAK